MIEPEVKVELMSGEVTEKTHLRLGRYERKGKLR